VVANPAAREAAVLLWQAFATASKLDNNAVGEMASAPIPLHGQPPPSGQPTASIEIT
jgi:hypothetical protein